jgi:REP element-mobilizing transposase RayT
LSLGQIKLLKKIAQLIKGESSYWFNNKSSFNASNLEWQDEYFAVSVGESRLDSLRTYVDNQETHHRKETFPEEYRDFGSKQFS